MLPFIRAFASIVSGLVDIPPLRFGFLSGIGTLVYVAVLSCVGYKIGGEWSKVNHSLTQITYIVVAVVAVAIVAFVVLALVALVIHRVREFRREAATSDADKHTPAHRVRR